MKYANRGVVDTDNYKDHEREVPYAEITLCCGFLLVYFIEELVLAIAKEGGEEERLNIINCILFLASFTFYSIMCFDIFVTK